MQAKKITLYSFEKEDQPHTIYDSFHGSCPNVNKYKKLNRVGEGTYGIVYRAKPRDSETIVALKRIRMVQDNEGFPISALREISLLRQVKHENIVSLLDVVVSDGFENIFMVMEYCEQDMAYLMDNVMAKNKDHQYNTSQIKCLMIQLLKGIDYLHSRYIIHRDLKLSNILLNSRGILKIADFGLARIFEEPVGKMTPRVVTLWYRAPEILLGSSNYNKAIDLWSIGCIFGEFLKSEPILPGQTDIQQLTMICELLGTPNTKIWPELEEMPSYATIKLPSIPYDSVKKIFSNSSELELDLLEAFLVYRPKNRISARRALLHEYFRETPKACPPMLLPTYPELRNKRKRIDYPTNMSAF